MNDWNRRDKQRTIVLIQGLPGAGKTVLAKLLLELISTAGWVNADYVRTHISRSLTFTLTDRIEHARRMAAIANLTLNHGANDCCIVDFVCPTEETRQAFLGTVDYPVYAVFMDTITPEESRFADTRQLYQAPVDYSLRVSGYKTISELREVAHTVCLAIFGNSDNLPTFPKGEICD